MTPKTVRYRDPSEVIGVFQGYSSVIDREHCAEGIEINGRRVLTMDLSLPEEARREIERQFWCGWIRRP